MRIQHNIMAMNAYRNLSKNNGALSKNLEKLSSGYRINRAGDDAAGLAISEKMRAQIAGLDQAQKNAQSGINMVQTAEGALTEVHDMLNRMVTLATQAANGTYGSTDQAKIQSEIDSLTAEIDRIATNSNFNGTKLLNGDLAGAKVTQTAGTSTTNASQAATSAVVTLSGWSGKAVVVKEGSNTVATFTATGACTAESGWTWNATAGTLTKTAGEYTVGALSFVTSATSSNTVAGVSGTSANGRAAVAASTTGTAAKTEIDFTGMNGAKVLGGKLEVGDVKLQFVETSTAAVDTGYTAVVVAKNATSGTIATAVAAKLPAAGDYKAAAAAAGKVTIDENDVTDGAVAADLTVKQEGLGGMTLQIGASAQETITVTVDSMSAQSLGIDKVSMNVGDVASANAAIDTINAAIEKVSVQRSNLGAIQNRLEHTINNLGVMEENIQDAEANIRDTDIADEMMAYTKNNILIQSAQAMLAQANQVPQGVLQLMQ